jgi:methionine-rich copper-binding protein CopC
MSHYSRSIILATLTGLLLANAEPSVAEGTLIRSEPSDGEVLNTFDGTVRLWFSGNVSQRSPTLVVVDDQGNRVDNGDLNIDIGQRTQLSATTRLLGTGQYVVRYRVLTRDGLVVSGIYRFSIKS